MRNLLSRILCSAAHSMWEKNTTLGHYTSQTGQHELNLAFHYASELKKWFPWLNCDFDVTKRNCGRKRPDIILHRRGTNALNFLVVEVKREKSRGNVPAALKKIKDDWFGSKLAYRFGAAVILEDDKPHFEAQVLSGAEPDQAHAVLKHTDFGVPLPVPNLATVHGEALTRTVDRIAATKKHNHLAVVSELDPELDELLHEFYSLPPSKAV